MSVLEAPHNARAALAARELRQRLVAPAGAVRDDGINLRRHREPAAPFGPAPVKPVPAKPVAAPPLPPDPFSAVARQCGITERDLLEAINLVKSGRYGTRQIILEVCRQTGIPVTALISPRRHDRLVKYRHFGMALARHLTAQSFPMIGRCFKRDHSSVLLGARKMAHIIDAIAVPPGASIAEWVTAGLLVLHEPP